MTTTKPERPLPITRSALLDKLSAECVEELLLAAGHEGGTPWFLIIRRKIESALNQKEETP